MVVLLVHKMQVRHWKCVPNMHKASEQQQYRNSICARLWGFFFVFLWKLRVTVTLEVLTFTS